MSGWIKLYRKSLDNPLFKKPFVWHYWNYCLLKACHEKQEIIWNKKRFIIERGSFVTGRKQASVDTGLTEQNIRTSQQILINLKMIEKSTTKSTSKFSYITICNYTEYQTLTNAANQQPNQQLTSKQPATNQQLTTYKNDKNDKNDKNKKDYAQSDKPLKAVLFVKLIKRDGEYPVIQEKIDLWQDTYPGIDVLSELKKYRAWVDANPAKRKTSTGIEKSINYWLSKTQNNSGGPGQKRTSYETPDERLLRETKAMMENG